VHDSETATARALGREKERKAPSPEVCFNYFFQLHQAMGLLFSSTHQVKIAKQVQVQMQPCSPESSAATGRMRRKVVPTTNRFVQKNKTRNIYLLELGIAYLIDAECRDSCESNTSHTCSSMVYHAGQFLPYYVVRSEEHIPSWILNFQTIPKFKTRARDLICNPHTRMVMHDGLRSRLKPAE